MKIKQWNSGWYDPIQIGMADGGGGVCTESEFDQNRPGQKKSQSVHQDPVFGNPNPWPERLRSVQKVSQRPAHTLSYFISQLRCGICKAHPHVYIAMHPIASPKAYGNGGKTWKNSSYTAIPIRKANFQ